MRKAAASHQADWIVATRDTAHSVQNLGLAIVSLPNSFANVGSRHTERPHCTNPIGKQPTAMAMSMFKHCKLPSNSLDCPRVSLPLQLRNPAHSTAAAPKPTRGAPYRDLVQGLLNMTARLSTASGPLDGPGSQRLLLLLPTPPARKPCSCEGGCYLLLRSLRPHCTLGCPTAAPEF